MKRISLIITSLAVLMFCVCAAAADANTAALERATTGDHRSAENIARNGYRHPAETLTWFGIREDMTVGLSYEYLDLGKNNISQTSPEPSTLSGDYDPSHVHFVALTFTKTF